MSVAKRNKQLIGGMKNGKQNRRIGEFQISRRENGVHERKPARDERLRSLLE